LQKREVVAVVSGTIDEDPPAAVEPPAECEAPEGLRPRSRVALCQRHVQRIDAEEASDRSSRSLEGAVGESSGLVATHAGFQAEVVNDCFNDGVRRQRGACVVEVGNKFTTGRVGSQASKVQRHRRSLA
jgi:hypothetical protein